jgi:hypothetical protein
MDILVPVNMVYIALLDLLRSFSGEPGGCPAFADEGSRRGDPAKELSVGLCSPASITGECPVSSSRLARLLYLFRIEVTLANGILMVSLFLYLFTL